MALATLINKAGEKRVVEAGSSDAQTLFGQGFKLQTASGAPAEPFDTKVAPPATRTVPGAEPTTAVQDPVVDAVPTTNTDFDADIDGVVNSSDQVVQEERDTVSTVQSLLEGLQDRGAEAVRRASDDFSQTIGDFSSELERRRADEIQFINQQFQEAQAATEGAQKNEFGANVVGLQRIGGFLGGSASHIGRLNNLRASHRAELSSLEAKRAQAIRQANNAINDKQFEVAKALAQESKDLEETIFDRQNTFFEQALSLVQQQRLETSSTFDIIKDIPAGQQVEVNGQTFTGIDIADVKPFFTSSSLVSIMKELPVGESRELTDPNTGRKFVVQGIASSDPNVKTVQSTDDGGNVTITSYRVAPDGNLEVTSQTDLGRIGKTKTQPTSITLTLNEQEKTALQGAVNRLEENIGPDGFYNTDETINEIQDYSINNPGQIDNILDVVRDRLNPEDPKALQVITGDVEESAGGFEVTNANGVKIKF